MARVRNSSSFKLDGSFEDMFSDKIEFRQTMYFQISYYIFTLIINCMSVYSIIVRYLSSIIFDIHIHHLMVSKPLTAIIG